MPQRLTPTQKKILRAMRDAGGIAAFTGDSARKHGFGVFPAKHGGVVVRCYGTPEVFLKQRGFIHPIEREAPGYWFVITDKGHAVI